MEGKKWEKGEVELEGFMKFREWKEGEIRVDKIPFFIHVSIFF